MNVKMMKYIMILIFISSIAIPLAFPAEGPKLNGGKKWEIGFYEGGPYSDYMETMNSFISGLMGSGWIKKAELPVYDRELQKPYWDWLAKCDSSYLSFRSENSYSANWNQEQRDIIRKKMLKKLKSGSLDLVIAMGTWAGLDLANNKHSVPILVMSTSDPVGAGIIKSVEKSGYDHVTARVDPGRYHRQIRMFSRIAGFKTLGIAYENTPVGRVYSAIDKAGQVAEERGFKLVLCKVQDTTDNADVSDRSCFKCYRELADKCDAVYVTPLTCVDRQAAAIADIFRKARVPSFAMVGSRFVKKGLMLSISSDSEYAGLGRYNAMKFSRILNGTKPADLKQLFEDPLDIAVNMETVRQTGFVMPNSILKVAAEIYEK